VTTPKSSLVRAWGDKKRAIVVRCGVARPAELVETSQLFEVNGVTWFAVVSGVANRWVAVDRRPYLEVTVPTSISGDRVLSPLSKAVSRLPKVDVDLGADH
jgi:hypothetical protein